MSKVFLKSAILLWLTLLGALPGLGVLEVPQKIDFGNLDQSTKKIILKLEIQNMTKLNTRIVDIKGSCSCFRSATLPEQ